MVMRPTRVSAFQLRDAVFLFRKEYLEQKFFHLKKLILKNKSIWENDLIKLNKIVFSLFLTLKRIFITFSIYSFIYSASCYRYGAS